MRAPGRSARSVRAQAAVGLGVSLLVAAPLAAGVVWLSERGHGMWGPALGLPLLPAVYCFTELVTGTPAPELANRWDALAGWQRGVLGTLIVAVATGAILMIGAAIGVALAS